MKGLLRPAAVGGAMMLVLSACQAKTPTLPPRTLTPSLSHSVSPATVTPSIATTPPVNVYANTLSGSILPALQKVPPRVYVPNSDTNTVTVIDPTTFKVVDHFNAGRCAEHVAPAHDLTRLFVNDECSWSVTVIDPSTGRPTASMATPDPYNLYFTPDGSKAIVVQERLRRLEFRDPASWRVIGEMALPASGANHLDFSADGRFLVLSFEFDGTILKIDPNSRRVVASRKVGGYPIDVRLSPAGDVFFVANQGRNGVSVVSADALDELSFIPTGKGAHGVYLSRDTRYLYVSNRLEGTISVIDVGSRRVTATWRVGGSPDMLQLNPDGSQLWASSRFDGKVIVVDTATGAVIARIPSGRGAHGLCYFPAPGRISLGHNGVYR